MKNFFLDQKGQATVEYMIIGAAFICVICALGLLLHCVADGSFSKTIQDNASHSIESIGGIKDALLF